MKALGLFGQNEGADGGADGGGLKLSCILSQTHCIGFCRFRNLELGLGQLLGDDAIRSALDVRLFPVAADCSIDGSWKDMALSLIS